MTGQLVHDSQLHSLLERSMPLDRVVLAIGYGSGVFSQQRKEGVVAPTQEEGGATTSKISKAGASDTVGGGGGPNDEPALAQSAAASEKSLVDFIVVVDDAAEFHRQNLLMNPDHYPASSFMGKILGRGRDSDVTAAAERAAWIQRHVLPPNPLAINPGLYYVVDENRGIKYGVVHADDLAADLEEWRFLYLAGRLHKPTVTVHRGSARDAAGSPSWQQFEVLQATRNLPAALAASMLLVLEREEDGDLLASGGISSSGSRTASRPRVEESLVWTTLAGLSYAGDLRMQLSAEDPNKVSNLVKSPGSMQRFRHLYEDSIQALQRQGILSVIAPDGATPHAESRWSWDASPSARRHLVRLLPSRLRRAARQSSSSNCHHSLLRNELRGIVAPAARYQSLKGLVTAGPSWGTALRYAARKLGKGRWGGIGSVLAGLSWLPKSRTLTASATERAFATLLSSVRQQEKQALATGIELEERWRRLCNTR
jgi:translocator assembly and maintenance protein 41